jgi:hypothetical protein
VDHSAIQREVYIESACEGDEHAGERYDVVSNVEENGISDTRYDVCYLGPMFYTWPKHFSLDPNLCIGTAVIYLWAVISPFGLPLSQKPPCQDPPGLAMLPLPLRKGYASGSCHT